MPKRYAARPIAELGEANLARRIERLRKDRGLSFEALAKLMTDAGCTISKAALHSIEQVKKPRRITVNELVAFAAIFTDGDVVELLKPMEMVEQEWAEDVAKDFIDATIGIDDAHAALVRAAVKLADVHRRSPAVAEFVANRWKTASPGHQWFGEFVGTVDEGQLNNLAELGNAFWEQTLMVVDALAQEGAPSDGEHQEEA